MRKLSSNVKEIYDFRLKRKQAWINLLKNKIDSKDGDESDEKAIMAIACVTGGFSMVADPHIYLDLMIEIADWLEQHYRFFVPNPFIYRYSIPKKYGGYGGPNETSLDYVSMKYNLCKIGSFKSITKDLKYLMEHMKYMSIQNIGVEEKIFNNQRYEEFFVTGVDFTTEWSPQKYRKNWKKNEI